MDNFIIRPVTVEDASAIGDLWQQLVDYHHELDEAMPIAAADGPKRYAQRIVDRIYDTHSRVFVAEADGKVVGYILSVLVDLLPEMFVQERAGFIADIFVHSDYRKQGIGRGLVNASIKWFESLNVSHYELYVASSNKAGVEFWKSIGGRDVMIRMRAPIGENKND